MAAFTVLDFEVYVLVSMKLRLSMGRDRPEMQHTLAAHGLSVTEGELTHQRVSEALGDDEASFVSRLDTLLGVPIDRSGNVYFASTLWPDFDFVARRDSDGVLSARYWNSTGLDITVDSPRDVPLWSSDVDQFSRRFGPLKAGTLRPFTDEYLPSYEEREFQWNGRSYGAGFSWGLFMFAAESWD